MSHRILLFAFLIIDISDCRTMADRPMVFDDRLQLTLVAEHPQIVTPIGCTYDERGRLLVIESHTHFPPDDYNGPKHDRIRSLRDTNRDGRADDITTFYAGTKHTMSLRSLDEWIYVATRKAIFRLRDADGDGQAEIRENLIQLETPGDYPHNGLGGLAFDQDKQLLFGLGENLGAEYSVIGSDGTELQGGGEGGNVYTCDLSGKGLRKIATGFWNPFGICVDPLGRVFTVGNDPDARPPCRLVHVVEAGDYGYQFRFGRSGKHPLQAWDGELPGTLPMVAGTGEAPSAVVPYHGQLWVTSWGDYRIERFKLIPRGASFGATREIVVQGDNHFRPVDFAIAPDGSLIFTDWVNKSYPVHGQGRVWRLSWKSDPPTDRFPTTTKGERLAKAARQQLDFRNMEGDDAYLQTATIAKLASDRVYESSQPLESSKHRLGLIAAARWNEVGEPRRSHLLRDALSSNDTVLQLYAIRWISEAKLVSFLPSLEELAKTNRSSLRLFQATVAAIDWLETGKTEKATQTDYLEAVLANPRDYTPAFLVEALRSMPSEKLRLDHTNELIHHSDQAVQRAAVRSLALSRIPERKKVLQRVAASNRFDAETRADARVFAERNAHNQPSAETLQPAPTDVHAWEQLLRGSQGDANQGWRVFFGSGSGRCANCHTYQGRGASMGPDLTEVTKRLDRKKLIESILQPSREVAPRFVIAHLELSDGRNLAGMSLGVSKDGTEDFVSSEGTAFAVNVADIESRKFSDRSVMPDGLETTMSISDLRDLLALLSSGKHDLP